MAEGNGTTERDLLLRLIDGQSATQDTLRGLQGSVDKLNNKLENTNGTLTLIGRVLNELAVATQEQVADLRKRVDTIERAAES